MFPRGSDGKLDSLYITKIKIILDADSLFPEVAVAYTKGLCFIESITKELLDEIVSSGIDYQEHQK